jgi:hypothetical protein
VTLLIERQPQLPESPLLVLRLASSGLTVLARAASRFFDALPPGLRMENDLMLVDIAELLRQRRRRMASVHQGARNHNGSRRRARHYPGVGHRR